MNNLTKAGFILVASALAVLVAYFWNSIPGWLITFVVVTVAGYGLLLFSETKTGKNVFFHLKAKGGETFTNQKEKSEKELKKEIGEDYDSAVKRDRWSRWAFLVISLVVFLAGPGLVVYGLIGIVIEVPDLMVAPIMLVGAMLGGAIFSNYLPNYIVSVPQIQGFVTVNNVMALLGFKGVTDVVYGPGWHVSYPWEKRSEKSNFSLEVVTLEFEETVPGKDVRLIVTGALQVEAAVSRGARYIGIDEETLRKGGLEIIKGQISQDLHDKTGDQAKSMVIEETESLMDLFGIKRTGQDKPKSENSKRDPDGTDSTGGKTKSVAEFEKRYAVRTVAVTISGIDLPEDAQKTRDAVDEADKALTGVAAMFGYRNKDSLITAIESKVITPEQYLEMLDRFLAKSGDANMNINALKIAGLGLDVFGPLATKLLGGEK